MTRRPTPPAEVAPLSKSALQGDMNELHALLVQSVRDYAIFMLDRDGRVATWNDGAQRIKGYTAEEIVGKHFSTFYPQDKIAVGFPDYELREAARVGRFEDEGWRIRKDGTRFWANVVITALRAESGELIGFSKVTRDLTERRAAEEALRQGEERFRMLVQGVRDYAIFMLDTDGRVATWNEGAQRINGYTEHEAIGQHFSIFYPAEDLAANKPARELEIATREGKYEEEGWRVRKGGQKFWSSVLITALRNESGELVGFGKVTRDLTERRAAASRALDDARRLATEEAGRRSAEERARELRALADQLHRQAGELEVRSREAEAANRAKSEFLAAMSHELRTPLNAIGGYAQLLEMELSGPVTDAQREQLERIRRSQRHLLGIINDILNFSRIEAGQLDYEIEPVVVHEVAESVMQMIHPLAVSKGITLESSDADSQATALVDRPKLEQIVLNLLSNAVKFTGRGGRITCDYERRGDDVVITVTDTGVGVPADQLDAIFEPFVQVGRSLTNTREGTGLGLSISRDLARAMGGDISVESRVGAGSTFTVRLPAA